HVVRLSSASAYFKGVSLRKIAHHIEQFYGLKVAHTTLYNWIKRYTKLIEAYVEKLEPKLSAIWHVDEMKAKADGKWVWLWNMMDEETRFLLTSMITKKRDISDARKVFQKAKGVAKGKPEVVVSDGLPAYIKAFNKEFFTLRNPRTKHIRMPQFTDPVNNNIVERLQGTIRERDKVLGGMDGEITGQDLINGLRVYYNFIRPHMSLNGKTPAEEAGIDLNLKGNKWLSLIEKAYNNRNEQSH
ncbi:MAG: DDE-type integrase/transposase/recombinase, partial [Candidatus Bathyarchaeia archaeon]